VAKIKQKEFTMDDEYSLRADQKYDDELVEDLIFFSILVAAVIAIAVSGIVLISRSLRGAK